MGYRTFDDRPAPPKRTMQDTATPAKVFVHNGCTADLAIPCWYQEIHPPVRMKPHDRPRHDHMGWPSPGRPDMSCQLYEPFEAGFPPEPCHTHMGGHPPVRKLVDMSRVYPIHLGSEDEGYGKARVSFVGDHDGIIATASIDADQDWIVRVRFEVRDANALEEPQTYRFTVFVDAEATEKLSARSDIVCLGELVVLPAAY